MNDQCNHIEVQKLRKGGWKCQTCNTHFVPAPTDFKAPPVAGIDEPLAWLKCDEHWLTGIPKIKIAKPYEPRATPVYIRPHYRMYGLVHAVMELLRLKSIKERMEIGQNSSAEYADYHNNKDAAWAELREQLSATLAKI